MLIPGLKNLRFVFMDDFWGNWISAHWGTTETLSDNNNFKELFYSERRKSRFLLYQQFEYNQGALHVAGLDTAK